MTRVNLVYVQDLADQHLFAEWREIKMVPAALRRSLKTRTKIDVISGIPKHYTLNTGHVSFFFDKMNFLVDRYNRLTEELKSRFYDISDHSPTEIFYKDIPSEFKTKDWSAFKEDIVINVERINLRISEKPNWYKYYGNPVSPEYLAELYKLQIDRAPNRC